MQEAWVQSLGWEDPLVEDMETHSSILAWRIPWTARRSNQSILKEINPEYSWERLVLKLKLQYSGHLMQRVNSLEKTLMLGKFEGRKSRGMTEDEMVGWHHRLNGRGFGWTLGVGDGQEDLVCCG